MSSASASRRSAAGASHSSGSVHRATASSRRCRACSLRSRSVSRREATVISQPRGLSGTPSRRPLRGGGEQRLLHRVLGGVEVPVAPDQRAEDLRRQPAQQVLDALTRSRRAQISRLGRRLSTIGRTSAYRSSARACSGRGRVASRAAISVARSKLSHSTIHVAGEHLLGLGVRPVGHHRDAVLQPRPAGCAPAPPGRGSSTSSPDSTSSLLNVSMNARIAAKSSGGPGRARRSPCRPARRSPAATPYIRIMYFTVDSSPPAPSRRLSPETSEPPATPDTCPSGSLVYSLGSLVRSLDARRPEVNLARQPTVLIRLRGRPPPRDGPTPVRRPSGCRTGRSARSTA